jgi:hypothetical protein
MRRQPVILTDEQLEKINKEHPGFLREEDVIKYGSDETKQFNYICPRYWCLLTNTIINPTEMVKDKNGKVRTFMLRRSAAKEAHTHDGIVYPMDKGYVIKIKGKQNAKETNESIQKERSSITDRFGSVGASIHHTNGAGGRTSGRSETITEKVAESKTKITLAQIRAKKEKAITEAIDMGIEAGISMSQSGENPGRGTDKINKKGRVSPIEELTGDETTASIGDQKEDELKKVGINLTSFRKRNYAV